MKTKSPIILVAALILLLQACAVKKPTENKHKTNLDLAAVKIKLQNKNTYTFEKEQVFFSNNFPSARLNQLVKVNDSTFNITIEAENRPINPSAWFAFKVWGKPQKNVYINLSYPSDRHRYQPKISTNGQQWQTLAEVKVNKEKNEASFKLQLQKDTLTVAAQEIISSGQSYQWMNQLAKNYSLNKTTIGYSIGGKPIIALNSTKSDGKKIVVVLSRQHPPEISGYMAMERFVETLLGNSKLAKNFIKNYELVIVPMVNPDGVDEGNWRHSFGGVDLNRDWEFFKQPETRAVRDYLLNKISKQNAKVEFALDFHSTYNDVMYVNDDRSDTNRPGLMNVWIASLHQFEGAVKTPVKPSGNGGNTSKAWFGRVLNAEAVTYEVGDNTPRDFLNEKAVRCADILMAELLK
ncbi:M14 family metallopeptidase [Pedobacter sp. UBA4863]|uniref:M14 family metallopeptidase n=1 Tax=Pedobacter sp. UBA4863 TaxID=1947060 RepID=UPI0025DC0A7D|nr:M14 family metallopeptidase [Pedobacter sp. UBA4863]